MDKKELRQKYINLKKTLDANQRLSLDRSIYNNFLKSEFYKESEGVLLFASKGYEEDTREIIKKALSDGKKVALPKCRDGNMEFYRIKSLSELTVGAFGIDEPSGNEKSENYSLCIVPCICCDKKGYRVGKGGGYYDRFLKEFTGKSVILAYDFAVLDEIPYEEHDIKCDAVITDKGVKI